MASQDCAPASTWKILGRSPGLVTACYLLAGGTMVPLAAPLDPAGLIGWLLFTAAILYLLLDRMSSAAADRAAARARESQRVAEACLDTVMHVLPDPLVIADEAGRIRDANRSMTQAFGHTVEDALDMPVADLLAEPSAGIFRTCWQAYLQGDADNHLLDRCNEVVAIRDDGTTFPAELSVAPLERGNQRRFVVVLHDISARKTALDRLRVADKVLESTMEGVLVTDRRGAIQWVNQGFCRISGYEPDEVVGQNAHIMKSGLQSPDFYTAMWKTIEDDGEWAGEIWNRRKNGEAYPEWLSIKAIADEGGEITRYVGVFSDISTHKRAEETIRTLTYYDAVTHLPNRELFMDRLVQTLERGQRNGTLSALVMIGLDRFKQINETLGHQIGDQVLCSVAERLAGSLRGHDTVARLRGDTFCCLLTDLAQNHDAHLVISRLLDCFSLPFEPEGHEVFVTAAIGISVFPMDGTEAEDLVLKAETAMNRSKEQAEAAYQFYTPEMHTTAMARLKLETELRKALARGELAVHYQPKIDTISGRVAGGEALLRWTHHELGAVSPAQFIPIAEETGLIVAIGAWVLDEVCRQLRQWQDDGVPVVQIAVNLSALQFRQPELVEQVVEAFGRHHLEPGLIELELTESAVMHNAEAAAATLIRLHDHGIHLAVDDFGTGYSSLSYLKRFPLDKLKIDRSFVMDIDSNPASVEIVGAIIAMGHSLNLDIVAEGVENDDQLAVLRALRCDEIQGFYYSRPVPPETFAGIVRIGCLDGQPI